MCNLSFYSMSYRQYHLGQPLFLIVRFKLSNKNGATWSFWRILRIARNVDP
jgi:hypothetical protein